MYARLAVRGVGVGAGRRPAATTWSVRFLWPTAHLLMALSAFATFPAPLGKGKYDGIAHAHSTVVFAPYGADHIGLLDQATHSFSNVTLPFRGHHKYSGAAHLNGKVYFTPHSADHVGILDVALRTFSTATVRNSNMYKYSGAAHSTLTNKLYFGPYNERTVGVFDPARSIFSTITLPDVQAGRPYHSGRYSGALATRGGARICFVPYNNVEVLLLDTTSETFATVPLTGAAYYGSSRYAGGAVVEGAGVGAGPVLYLAPFNQHAIGVVDVDTRTFTTIPIPFHGLAKYSGATHLHGRVYFAPCASHATREAVRPPPRAARAHARGIPFRACHSSALTSHCHRAPLAAQTMRTASASSTCRPTPSASCPPPPPAPPAPTNLPAPSPWERRSILRLATRIFSESSHPRRHPTRRRSRRRTRRRRFRRCRRRRSHHRTRRRRSRRRCCIRCLPSS